MSLNHSPQIVTNGLVLCLDAADIKSYPRTGTTWFDRSGNGNNGTLVNGPTYSNGSIVFNGSNQYINGVHNAQLDLTTNITTEVWFKLNTTPTDWIRTIGKGDSSNRTTGLWINYNTFLYQRYGASGTMQILITKTLVINKWYHFVGSSQSGIHTLYIDGVDVGTSNLNVSFYSSTQPYTMGYGMLHAYLNGYIGLGRIYNRGLTATEILQNYNAMKGRYGL